MSKLRSHINERLHTELANKGRAAGMGISYDNYGDGSDKEPYSGTVHVMLPSDYLTAEERKALSGEVRVYKEGKYECNVPIQD